MPDHEFDLYLNVLSRLLRLQPSQREEIADELRDHLEERLAELEAAGVSHDDAVRRALEEFGDAAGLAADFKQISRLRTRRTLMRWTMGTAVITAVAIFCANAFWPDRPGAPAPQIAQGQGFGPQQPGAGGTGGIGQGGFGPGQPKPRVSRSVSRKQNVELENKLATKLDKVEWLETPVSEVILQLSKKIKADIVIDKKHFDNLGHDLKTDITLTLTNTKVSARTALEFALERAGFDDVAITFRDGLVYLTSRDNDRHIEVYPCADLLKTANNLRAGAMGDAGGAHPGGEGGGAGDGGFAGPGGVGGGPMGPMGAGGSPRRAGTPAAKQLMNVIQATITSTEWVGFNGAGGGASIAEFNGMLVVTASRTAHRDIKMLLEKLREVAARKRK